MNTYVLVMRGDHAAFNAFSPDEKQQIMERYYAYVRRLKDEGRFKGGTALSNKSRQLSAKNDKITVVDGPYPDAKEALNGYFVFEAEDLAEAEAIARDCPCLTHGETCEVIETTTH